MHSYNFFSRIIYRQLALCQERNTESINFSVLPSYPTSSCNEADFSSVILRPDVFGKISGELCMLLLREWRGKVSENFLTPIKTLVLVILLDGRKSIAQP